MKKIRMVLVIILLSFCALSYAQNGKSTLFKTKEGNIPGQIEVKICSDDILEYKLTVFREVDQSVFVQKGYALIIDFDEQTKNGVANEETIGSDANPVPVHQYLVKCKCEKWLNIKVAKDFSVIKVDCGKDLINDLLGNQLKSDNTSLHLGYFYPVNYDN